MLRVNIHWLLFLAGFIFKCHYRPASSGKPWSQFQWQLLLDINRSFTWILDGFQHWVHLCTQLFKMYLSTKETVRKRMRDLIMYTNLILTFEDFTEIWHFAAPGSSRTIISHEKFSHLKEKENLDNSCQEKELTCVYTHITAAEATSIGEMLLTILLYLTSLKNKFAKLQIMFVHQKASYISQILHSGFLPLQAWSYPLSP